jgi:hypothetical protein
LAREDLADLKKFLKPFPADVKEKVLWLRDFIWSLYPRANELIYDNYNALAFGWSPTDRVGHTFCSIAVFRTNFNIHCGFYWGSRLADPEKKLLGGGNQYRYILFKDKKEFPKAYVKKLTEEAHVYSLTLVKDPKQIMQSKTIVKSISAAKRKKKEK